MMTMMMRKSVAQEAPKDHSAPRDPRDLRDPKDHSDLRGLKDLKDPRDHSDPRDPKLLLTQHQKAPSVAHQDHKDPLQLSPRDLLHQDHRDLPHQDHRDLLHQRPRDLPHQSHKDLLPQSHKDHQRDLKDLHDHVDPGAVVAVMTTTMRIRS